MSNNDDEDERPGTRLKFVTTLKFTTTRSFEEQLRDHKEEMDKMLRDHAEATERRLRDHEENIDKKLRDHEKAMDKKIQNYQKVEDAHNHQLKLEQEVRTKALSVKEAIKEVGEDGERRFQERFKRKLRGISETLAEHTAALESTTPEDRDSLNKRMEAIGTKIEMDLVTRQTQTGAQLREDLSRWLPKLVQAAMKE